MNLEISLQMPEELNPPSPALMLIQFLKICYMVFFYLFDYFSKNLFSHISHSHLFCAFPICILFVCALQFISKMSILSAQSLILNFKIAIKQGHISFRCQFLTKKYKF